MKQTFIVYDSNTGFIKSVHHNKQELVEFLLQEGESYLAYEGDVENCRVVNKEVVLRPQEDLDAEELNRAWFNFRGNRNYLLSECDWTQVPDAPVDAAAWATYRQQLRDLPANTTDPRNVVWPEPPS
jgi:hypothetical protein